MNVGRKKNEIDCLIFKMLVRLENLFARNSFQGRNKKKLLKEYEEKLALEIRPLAELNEEMNSCRIE